jgi:urocanate hydratase
VVIGRLCARGSNFFDYGNAFLLEASRSGADVMAPPGDASAPREFKYPSYVQHIMGEIFSLGFGPFRWFCASTDPADLRKTDAIATEIVAELHAAAPEETRLQYADNLRWIRGAESYQLVVGSQGRILYSDAAGRTRIALAFNAAVRDGRIGPVVLSRDHHDVSGTDSPYRETSSVLDGSSATADMAVNNHTGLAARGVTWVALHNGGGVGWGEVRVQPCVFFFFFFSFSFFFFFFVFTSDFVPQSFFFSTDGPLTFSHFHNTMQVVNGGFGLVLDGSADLDARIPAIFGWDVGNGVARRAWAGSRNARWNAERLNADPDSNITITIASEVDRDIVKRAVADAGK